ncbi:hypothetical protein EVAR_8812_1 [Eumeta japonica]|uniref:Uncharacterized protein n=1 Tax=Eumeta variegata TaxID=151549 RepID=A0A4C1TTW1_EUMVA|nr:hypothetical protein EVAR_8812_1 [Eumeta japonica]
MKNTIDSQTDDTQGSPSTISIEPPFGSVDWIQYCSQLEGHLPSPIDVSLSDSTCCACPPLTWLNFDVYPHKIKLINTGHTRETPFDRSTPRRHVI